VVVLSAVHFHGGVTPHRRTWSLIRVVVFVVLLLTWTALRINGQSIGI
jgi:hypothetical protein